MINTGLLTDSLLKEQSATKTKPGAGSANSSANLERSKSPAPSKSFLSELEKSAEKPKSPSNERPNKPVENNREKPEARPIKDAPKNESSAANRNPINKANDAKRAKATAEPNEALRAQSSAPSENSSAAKPKNLEANSAERSAPAAAARAEGKELKPVLENIKRVVGAGEEVLEKSKVLAFLTGHLEKFDAQEIPGFVTNDPMINKALALPNVQQFLTEPVTLDKILDLVGIDENDSKKLEALSVDMSMMVAPKDFFRLVGLDPQIISSELELLKDNMQLSGVHSYMLRAAKMNGGLAKGGLAQDKLALPQVALANNENASAKGVGPEKLQNANLGGLQMAQGANLQNAQSLGTTQASVAPSNLNLNKAGMRADEVKQSAPKQSSIKGSQAASAVINPWTLQSLTQSMGQSTDSLVNSNLVPTQGASTNTTSANLTPVAFDPFKALEAKILASSGTESQKFSFAEASPKELPVIEQLIALDFKTSNLAPKDMLTAASLDALAVNADASEIMEGDIKLNLDKEIIAQEQNKWDSTLSTAKDQSPQGVNLQDKNVLGLVRNLALANVEKLDVKPELAEKRATQSEAFSSNLDTSIQTIGGVEGKSDLAQNFMKDSSGGNSGSSFNSPKENFAAKADVFDSHLRVNKEIVENVQALMEKGGGSLKMDIESSEMGKVELALQVKNDQVNVKVLTQSEVLKDAIGNDLKQLRDSLSSQNLVLRDVEVALSRNSQFGHQFQGQSQNQGFNFDQGSKQFQSDRERKPEIRSVKPYMAQSLNLARSIAAQHTGKIQVWA